MALHEAAGSGHELRIAAALQRGTRPVMWAGAEQVGGSWQRGCLHRATMGILSCLAAGWGNAHYPHACAS